MIDAHKAIFSHLERFCEQRGQPLSKPGLRRYVSIVEPERNFLINLKVGTCLRFGSHRSLTHLYLPDDHYIALLGFDFEPSLATAVLDDLGAGKMICLLSEVLPLPVASPAEIRNIVEVGSMDDGGEYSGHAPSAVESLFPSIHFLRCNQPVDEDAVWRIFLMICAQECSQGASWVEEDLATALLTLTDLNVPSLPYSAVCRSMFDADPRSLFMALYRCIEATYAYEATLKLASELGLSSPWHQVAATLDNVISWRPKEATSLNAVLRHAVESDLREVCNCLKVDVGSSSDISATAGKAIYKLRNNIVHYRPGIALDGHENIDWNRLCEILVGIVFHVFTKAYD